MLLRHLMSLLVGATLIAGCQGGGKTFLDPDRSVFYHCKLDRRRVCVRDMFPELCKKNISEEPGVRGEACSPAELDRIDGSKDTWGHSFVVRKCPRRGGKCNYSLGFDGIESSDDVGCDTDCGKIEKLVRQARKRKGLLRRLFE